MARNSEKLLDLSVTISDNEFTTFTKVKDIVEPLNIDKIFVKNIDIYSFQDFVVRFPNKTLNVTITLWGGGSSGIKPSYNSTIATGGYSSGTIVRFPIEIKNLDEAFFASLRIGKGGEGFEISQEIKMNNGEFSNFELFRGITGDIRNTYRSEAKRAEAKLLEGLSCYGSGISMDGSIIQSTSTISYFSFEGSNPSNTLPQGVTGIFDYNKFYSPYLSVYNGYNSFIGCGGEYNGNSNAQPNSGAGGAGVLNRNFKNYVGSGGNGGCIIEYEGSDKIEVFITGYIYVEAGQNFITFIIMDSNQNETEYKLTLDPGIYSINYIISVMKQFILNYSDIEIIKEKSNLVIKMGYRWSISFDSNKSAGDLLNNLGIKSKDLYDSQNNKIIPPYVENSFKIKFSGDIIDICQVSYLENNLIYS
jgi:hypothetical protein